MNPGLHGGDLDDVTNNKEEDAEAHALPPTPPVRRVGPREGAAERPDAHEGYEEGLNDRDPGKAAVRLFRGEPALEVGKEEHGGDLAGVVTEQETPYGGDDTEENGLGAAFCAIDANRPEELTMSVLFPI